MTRIEQWRTTVTKDAKPASRDWSLLTLEGFLILCLILLSGFIFMIVAGFSVEDQTVAIAAENSSALTPSATLLATQVPAQVVIAVPLTATPRILNPSATPTASQTPVPVPTRFVSPTAGGSASIEGIDVSRDPLTAKKHVSFVSENVMLYGNFTAFQNLDYFARLAGKRNLKKEQYAEILSRVGLGESFHGQRVRYHSKGMRQKLAIAIAMIKDAPNIILDEPTSGLDPKAASEFLGLIRELRRDGKSIFMSTHDLFRANEIADRIGILREGRLILTRTKAELEGENLNDLYLRSMAIDSESLAAGEEL